MALANVELTNTFDEWRTRTNQIIVQGEQTLVNVATLFTRVDNGNLWANSVGTRSNTYADSVGVRANTYADSVGVRANTYADSVGVRANTYADSVGVRANNYSVTYADAVGVRANNYSGTYADSVGVRANTYADSVGVRANTYSDSVGVRANNFATSAVATEAALARSATNLTSGTIPVARVSGNYNLITGLGTISSGTWQGSTIAVDRGGTGVTSIGGIQTALGLGSLAYLSSVGTANITDNSVNGAKIALGSDATGDLMYFNGTDWARLPAGTSGQVLRTNGTSTAPAWVNKITTLETKTTSGLNAYDFTTGIPTWARRVSIIIKDVEASSATPELLVQLGTQSGGIQTSGYSSYTQFINDAANVAETTNATGFVAYMSTNLTGYKGIMTLLNISGNDWMQTHLLSKTGSAIHGTGYVTLTNPLYSIRFTLSTLSTYTFAGGTVTVLYE